MPLRFREKARLRALPKVRMRSCELPHAKAVRLPVSATILALT